MSPKKLRASPKKVIKAEESWRHTVNNWLKSLHNSLECHQTMKKSRQSKISTELSEIIEKPSIADNKAD